jgi:hypothetical protein
MHETYHAFPVTSDATNNGQEGMSLRAYFAAQAMQGLMANSHPELITMKSKDVAAWSVEQADALLAALTQPQQPAQQP